MSTGPHQIETLNMIKEDDMTGRAAQDSTEWTESLVSNRTVRVMYHIYATKDLFENKEFHLILLINDVL